MGLLFGQNPYRFEGDEVAILCQIEDGADERDTQGEVASVVQEVEGVRSVTMLHPLPYRRAVERGLVALRAEGKLPEPSYSRKASGGTYELAYIVELVGAYKDGILAQIAKRIYEKLNTQGVVSVTELPLELLRDIITLGSAKH